jgi:hypothetical protein
VLFEEAQIGKRVREDHRTAIWRGREGKIIKRWGAPPTLTSTCSSTAAYCSCSGTTS